MATVTSRVAWRSARIATPRRTDAERTALAALASVASLVAVHEIVRRLRPDDGQQRTATRPTPRRTCGRRAGARRSSPRSEPVVVARRPLDRTPSPPDVLAHGTGALNIDGLPGRSGEPKPATTTRRRTGNARQARLHRSEAHGRSARPTARSLARERRCLDESQSRRRSTSRAAGARTGVAARARRPARRRRGTATARGRGLTVRATGVARQADMGGASRFFMCVARQGGDTSARTGDGVESSRANGDTTAERSSRLRARRRRLEQPRVAGHTSDVVAATSATPSDRGRDERASRRTVSTSTSPSSSSASAPTASSGAVWAQRADRHHDDTTPRWLDAGHDDPTYGWTWGARPTLSYVAKADATERPASTAPPTPPSNPSSASLHFESPSGSTTSPDGLVLGPLWVRDHRQGVHPRRFRCVYIDKDNRNCR